MSHEGYAGDVGFFEDKLKTDWQRESYSLTESTKFEDRVRA